MTVGHSRDQPDDTGHLGAPPTSEMLSELIPQQLWTANPDGALDYVNGRVTSYFGRTSAEMIGWGWRDLIHPDDVPETIARWTHSLTSGEPYEIEFRLWCAASNDYRWHLAQALPVRDQSGVIAKWFGSNTDISARRKAEDERDQALADARRANEAKDHFLAVLSHELRTPLNPVLMAASAIETDPSISPELRADITMIRRNVELEARLIDDLLDFTRIANGKLELRVDQVDAHELVERATNIVRGDPSLTSPRLILDLTAPDFHIKADPARFQQIIWNLVKNAAKFTPAIGKVYIRSSNPEPSVWRLEVADTGRGISPELLSIIFKAFEQGECGASHKFGGLGLGLAISKALTELHHGTLTAKSEGLGHGAVFLLELPVTIPGQVKANANRRAPLLGATGLRILLVEDHETSGLLVNRLLERRGHFPMLARTLKEALALATAETFDVVVSDLGLPDGSGFDLMKELRDRHGLRGVALSGYGTDNDVSEGQAAGFVAHLTKPIDMERLDAALHAFILPTPRPSLEEPAKL